MIIDHSALWARRQAALAAHTAAFGRLSAAAAAVRERGATADWRALTEARRDLAQALETLKQLGDA